MGSSGLGLGSCDRDNDVKEDELREKLRSADWRYQRVAPGDFRRVATDTYYRWLRREAPLPLPPDADGHVKMVIVTVALVERRALLVLHVEYSRRKVDAAALPEDLDEEHSRKVMRAVYELQERQQQEALNPGSAKGGPVIDAKLRFLTAKRGWRPMKEDEVGLRAVINRRAGWELMSEERRKFRK
jgi:hypothetical protein